MGLNTACLIPGQPCTLSDIDALGAAFAAAHKANPRDSRLVLVCAPAMFMGLVSLSEGPVLGPFTPSLDGCRKSTDPAQVAEWAALCHKAAPMPMVPLPAWQWRGHMMALLACLRHALAATHSAEEVVAMAIAKAAKQTKH